MRVTEQRTKMIKRAILFEDEKTAYGYADKDCQVIHSPMRGFYIWDRRANGWFADPLMMPRKTS